MVSGSGNVAQYTVEKVIELGGKVVTMSDSDGYIYDPDGIDREKLDFIMELKNLYRGRIREYAEKYGCKYVAGARPWGEKGDIALPSATQNELNGDEAKQLVANGVIAVSEGANMPSTLKLSAYSKKPKSCMPWQSSQCRRRICIWIGNDSKFYQTGLESRRSRRKIEKYHEKYS